MSHLARMRQLNLMLPIITDGVLSSESVIYVCAQYMIPSRRCKLGSSFLSLFISDNGSFLFLRQWEHVLILFLSCTSKPEKKGFAGKLNSKRLV